MTAASLTREEILGLLRSKLGEVLDRDPVGIDEQARFDADLQADSLDLVEVIESVERQLRLRGVELRLPEAELVSLRTVGDAADRLMEASAEART